MTNATRPMEMTYFVSTLRHTRHYPSIDEAHEEDY